MANPLESRRLTIKLSTQQRTFFNSPAQKKCFCGGVGSGKSFILMYDLLRRAKPNRLYMVGAPTYRMLADATIRSFKALAEKMRMLRRYVEDHAYLANGAEVLFRSADEPERFRAMNLSGLVLDEASQMDRLAYDLGIARLRQGEFGEIGELGWVTAGFTPRGRKHWTYQVFARPDPLTGRLPEGQLLVQASSDENPFLPAEFVATARREMTGALREQELGGKFIDADDGQSVIPESWILAAQARWQADGWTTGPLSAIGVDVARGGADATCIAQRHGLWIAPVLSYPGKATCDGASVAALVMPLIQGQRAVLVNVDSIGIGASAYDAIVRVLPGYVVSAVNFARKVEAMDRYRLMQFSNLRAFAYWSLREVLDPSNPADELLALPPDDELLVDLAAPHWEMGLNGIKIEPKDDISARIGRSPDKGDAVVLACLLHASATELRVPSRLAV